MEKFLTHCLLEFHSCCDVPGRHAEPFVVIVSMAASWQVPGIGLLRGL